MQYIPWYMYFLLHPRPLSYNPPVRLRWRWCMRAARTLWCARPRWLGFWRYHHLFSTTAPSSSFKFCFLACYLCLDFILSSFQSISLALPWICHFFCSCNSLISTQCTMHISCACAYCARQCKPKHRFLNKQRFHPKSTYPVQCDSQFIILIQKAAGRISLVKKTDSKRLGQLWEILTTGGWVIISASQHWEIFTTESASQHWVGERRIIAISTDPSCASFSAPTFAQIQSHTFAHKCGLILLARVMWPFQLGHRF